MPDEPMTLIERLRNPQWVKAPGYSDAILHTERARKDMDEAATAIEDLARMAAKFLTRIAVQASDVLPSEKTKCP